MDGWRGEASVERESPKEACGQMGELMEKTAGKVQVIWTKAHVAVKYVLDLGIKSIEIIGNECVDALAKRGAALGGLDMNPLSKVSWADRTSMLIRNRLLFIQRHLITQGVKEGREEEEKRRRKAHVTRATRLKRKKDDQDCIEAAKDDGMPGETAQAGDFKNQVVASWVGSNHRRRLRMKTSRDSEHWIPPLAEKLAVVDVVLEEKPRESVSTKLTRESRKFLEEWKVKADGCVDMEA